MAGINLSFVANVREFLRGTKDVETSLEGVADALDDVAKEGADAPEKIEKSFTESFRKIRSDADTAGRSVGPEIEKGSKRAAEGLDEIKDSARQNAIETAASFDGTRDSIADGFQGLGAEMFAGFGPAGVAAGVAAAAGLGILRSHMEQAREEAQETAEQIAEIAGELIDLGDLKLDDGNVIDNLREAASTAEDGKIALQTWADAAREAGVSFSDYARGMAGDSEALQRSYDAVTGKLKAYQDGLLNGGVDAYKSAASPMTEYIRANEEQVAALKRAKDALEDRDFTLDRGSQIAQMYTDVTAGLADSNVEAARAAEDAARAQEAFRESVKDAVDPISAYSRLLDEKKSAEREAAEATAAATKDSKDSWEDYAKDVNLTIDELITDLDEQAERTKAFKDNLAKIAAAGGSALAEELQTKGPEVAGAIADLIANADPAKQAEYLKKYGATIGETMSSAVTTALSGTDVVAALQDAANKASSTGVEVKVRPVAEGGITSPSAPDQAQATVPKTVQMTPPAQPMTVVLSAEDRALLRAIGDATVAVTVPVTIDSTRVATAMRNARAAANTSGRRS
ncbi:hypothetical protein [Cellulomonas uda]|uniref:Uncharacterized protein n=1 Tax=Cellulomonas uda TaxID=1714 RepID=A0A4Y3KES1_CELUD|nr:hypothetical protein [Cellulomonas uda]NII65558.1 hypothetical protein [Cellulomonas uda]GEA81410.1 hypothetical protein CUD01_18540 [Cellulomonas uda]